MVRWSKGSWFISTKVNPWHSQTTNRSIRDHFSIKQNHQGPSQRRLTNIWKNPKFGQFQWGGRWDGGDWPTSSKLGSKLNFHVILHGQRVLSQKMGTHITHPWGLKRQRIVGGQFQLLSRSLGMVVAFDLLMNPIIISGKVVKVGCWVVGGSVVKGKLFQINQSQPLALPNNQQKH